MSTSVEICEEACHDVSWEFIEVQLYVALAPWLCLTIGGLAIALLLQRVPNKNLSQRLLIFEEGVCSTGVGASTLLLVTHLLQSLFFAMRTNARKVNAGYHSVELVLSIMVVADIFFKWLCTLFEGWSPFLSYAFRDLTLDCIVMTPAVAIMVPVDEKHTWFSFAYLASYRLLRLLRRGILVNDIKVTWRFRVAYHILTFLLLAFAASSTVMLFEHLGDEPVDTELQEWKPSESLVFMAFTIGTIGGGELTPRTTMGRALAIVIIIWASLYVYKPLVSLSFSWLVKHSVDRSSSLPVLDSRWGHAVICGTPKPFMIMDFLHEIYHLDNYKDTVAFVDDAPNVVIMVPKAETLQAMSQLLRRRDCLDFRARVHLLQGDAVDGHKHHLALMQTARLAFVLPNLHTPDVHLDDAGNLLRAYAMSRLCHTICLLHCCASAPQRAGEGAISAGNITFFTVDAFKMSLMAKACISHGVAGFLCNLWRTVGVSSSVSSAEPWQKQYLEGLCHEIYEVELSSSYDGARFGEICLDVVSRSQNADVYLIGLSNVVVDDRTLQERRLYRIHPGAEFEVSITPGSSFGVFIAQNSSSIKQAKPGEEFFDDYGQRRARTTLRANVSHADLDSMLGSAYGRGSYGSLSEWSSALTHSPTQSTLSPSSSRHDLRSQRGGETTASRTRFGTRLNEKLEQTQQTPRTSQLAVEDPVTMKREPQRDEQAAPSADQDAEKPSSAVPKSDLPKKYYDNAMRDLQRSMLVYGVSLGAVTDICSAVALKDPHAAAADADDANGLAEQQENTQDTKFGRRLHQWNTEEGRHQAVEHYHNMYNRLVHDVASPQPHPPPPGMLEAGGHIIICVAMGRPSHKRATLGEQGPDLCLKHFLGPLQEDISVDGSAQPNIVILSDTLPKDWCTALEAGNVYFVKGSPLQPADLERVKIHLARAVAIVRGGTCENERNGGTDAHVILATTLIEQTLPSHSKIPVVTQLVFDSSISFLPIGGRGTGTNGSAQRLAPKAKAPRQVEEPMLDLRLVVSGLRRAGFFIGGASEPIPQKMVVTEDYSELWEAQPLEHPRFMQGQIVFSSLLMQLAGKSLHNPSQPLIVRALLETPMLVLQVPEAFVRRSIMDLFVWLLKERNLLGIAIYRHSHADPYWKKDEERIEYIFTGPKACDEVAFQGDQIICLVPSVRVHP